MLISVNIDVTEEEHQRILNICELVGISIDDYFTIALHNLISESITTQTAFLQAYAVDEFYPIMLVINEMDLCKITALGMFLTQEEEDNEPDTAH